MASPSTSARHRMWQRVDAVVQTFRQVKNPLPFLADLADLPGRSYEVVLRNGLRFRLRPGTLECIGLYETVLRRDYLRGPLTLHAGDTVVDLGANIGCFSVLASSIVGPRGRVVAVEPGPSTVDQIHENIALNHAWNVLPVHAAISDRTGTTRLYVSPCSTLHSLYASVNDRRLPGPTIEVTSRTLEQLFLETGVERVHFLKMDCEGAEHDVIRSLTPALASRIDQISVAVHRVPDAGVVELLERLRALGFTLETAGLSASLDPIWYAYRRLVR